jgi:hypothetical protein
MSRKPQCPVACQDGLSADPDLAHLPSKPGNCDRLDRSWRSRSAIRQASCSRPRLHRASCPVRHYSAGWHSLQACRAIIDVAPVAAIIYRSSNRTDWRDPRSGCMPVPPPPTTLGRADNWIMAGRQLSPYLSRASPTRNLPPFTNIARPTLSRACARDPQFLQGDCIARLPRTTRSKKLMILNAPPLPGALLRVSSRGQGLSWTRL